MPNISKSSSKLLQFLELHKKWSGWLGVDQTQIEKNTLWHQCIEMVDNHFTFIGLNKAGHHSSQENKSNEYFCSNHSFIRFIWESYVAFQCMAIRRITDNNADENHSLKELLLSLKRNSHLITRETFVCYLGYPYEYEEELKAHNRHVTEKLLANPGIAMGFDIPKSRFSEERHEIFDRLSCTPAHKRKSNDEIQGSYWNELEEKLAIPEIKQVRNFADKYLAHSANKKSASILNDDDKTLSLKKIESCHLAILEVFHRLTLDFWFSSAAVEPINHRITSYMEKPYASLNSIEITTKMLHDKEREYLRIQGITLG